MGSGVSTFLTDISIPSFVLYHRRGKLLRSFFPTPSSRLKLSLVVRKTVRVRDLCVRGKRKMSYGRRCLLKYEIEVAECVFFHLPTQ